MPPRRSQGRRSTSSQARAGNARKTRQLCSQIARTVDAVLAGEVGDEALREVIVHKVEPAPDESRLLVTVGPYVPGIHLDPTLVIQHLHAAANQIRAEASASITRRRTPTLVYTYAEPLPPATDDDRSTSDRP